MVSKEQLGTGMRGIQRHSDEENPADGDVDQNVQAIESAEIRVAIENTKYGVITDTEVVENGSEDYPSPEEQHLDPHAKSNSVDWLQCNSQ